MFFYLVIWIFITVFTVGLILLKSTDTGIKWPQYKEMLRLFGIVSSFFSAAVYHASTYKW